MRSSDFRRGDPGLPAWGGSAVSSLRLPLTGRVSADHHGLAPDALAGAPLQVAPLGVMVPSTMLWSGF